MYDRVRNPYSEPSAQPENFVGCSLIVHSEWHLRTFTWTSSGFLWKKSILPFTG
jgi:hypothetical protein